MVLCAVCCVLCAVWCWQRGRTVFWGTGWDGTGVWVVGGGCGCGCGGPPHSRIIKRFGKEPLEAIRKLQSADAPAADDAAVGQTPARTRRPTDLSVSLTLSPTCTYLHMGSSFLLFLHARTLLPHQSQTQLKNFSISLALSLSHSLTLITIHCSLFTIH